MIRGILFGLFLLFIVSANGQSLRSFDYSMNLSPGFGLYNLTTHLNIGHSWYKEKKWGIKKSIKMIIGHTIISSDMPGDYTEERNYGLQTLFSVYHRSEKFKIELGAGLGPGIYYNKHFFNGYNNRNYFFPSGEFQWYISTGRLMKHWAFQLHSGIILASDQFQGYNGGFALSFYH
ncbi:MAG: hypothetical protein GC180_04520 [Bacteroidetes bacterium]|nr:hypothetical protein [Bacteroidota bacterium]